MTNGLKGSIAEVAPLVTRRRAYGPILVVPRDLLRIARQAGKHSGRRDCCLARSFHRTDPLKATCPRCNTQAAFGEDRPHTAFMSAGHPAMHEVQLPGTGVAVVTRP